MEFFMTQSQITFHTQASNEKQFSKANSNSSSESNKNQKILTKDFFLKMIRLENVVNSKKESSFSLVDELINMYTQCVEVYDSTQDPIQIYFLEKIQYVLSLENTIKGLLQGTNETKNKKQQEDIQTSENDNNYVKTLKREANHKLNVALTLKESEQSSFRQLNQMIEGYTQSAQQKDKMIQDQLHDQKITLDRRIQSRKSSVIENRTSSIRNLNDSEDMQELNDQVYPPPTQRYSTKPDEQIKRQKSFSDSGSVLNFLKQQFQTNKK